jgi:aquaporin Z
MTTSFDMRRGAAEALGTAGLVFFGGAAAMLDMPGPFVALSFGLAVALMITAFGGISGGHFNPAVSFAFFFSGKLSAKETVCYWASQIVGAALAVFALTKLMPAADIATMITQPLKTLSLGTAFAWEALMTCVFVSVILSVALDKRAATPLAPAAIGFTLFINALVGGGFTGASLNPARSLVPAYFGGAMDSQWVVYVAGPLFGALVAAFLAKYLRADKKPLLPINMAVAKPAPKMVAKAKPAAKIVAKKKPKAKKAPAAITK